MATISFDGVTKVFPDGTKAVDELDLIIGDGEFAVIVGPSGSGKSTALRMVAGLEGITSGLVRIDDRIVNDLQPRRRDVAMVFQNYALYPHKSVAENLVFGLKMQGVDRAERRRRAVEVARRLDIHNLLHRRPNALSGGQRQRVALGRAIVRDPQAFLMDEPLSNLDAKLRVEMRAYLTELHRELGATTLYVTHDQTEALTMGDLVAVMRDGRLEQCSAPQDLYDRPDNLFVAGFIGSPAMSVIRVEIATDDRPDSVIVRLGDQDLALDGAELDRRPMLRERVGGELLMGIRPEGLALANGAAPWDRVVELPALRTELLGSDVLVLCDAGCPAGPEGTNGVDGADGRGRVAARLPSGTPVTLGMRLPLVVDLRRVHFFDIDSHTALPVVGL